MTDRPTGGLATALRRARAGRNLGFGGVVGTVVALGAYYAYVITPEETAFDPALYLGLAAVLGVSVALLVGAVLSLLTMSRAGAANAH